MVFFFLPKTFVSELIFRLINKNPYLFFLENPKKSKSCVLGGMNGLYDQIVALQWIQANIQAGGLNRHS